MTEKKSILAAAVAMAFAGGQVATGQTFTPLPRDGGLWEIDRIYRSSVRRVKTNPENPGRHKPKRKKRK